MLHEPRAREHTSNVHKEQQCHGKYTYCMYMWYIKNTLKMGKKTAPQTANRTKWSIKIVQKQTLCMWVFLWANHRAALCCWGERKRDRDLVYWGGASSSWGRCTVWPLTLFPPLSRAPMNPLEMAFSAAWWLVSCVIGFFLSPPKRNDKKTTVRMMEYETFLSDINSKKISPRFHCCIF